MNFIPQGNQLSSSKTNNIIKCFDILDTLISFLIRIPGTAGVVFFGGGGGWEREREVSHGDRNIG